MKFSRTIYSLFLTLFILAGCGGSSVKEADYLLLLTDSAGKARGYQNAEGHIQIPPGKYLHCFTDTFRTYAIVATDSGFQAIDRNEHKLYDVFPYENGPDYPSDGLFRIVTGGKIGFADAATGAVLIQPQYECAYPFENGRAKVSKHCTKRTEGEHTLWESVQWQFIDRHGQNVDVKAEP